MLISNLEGFTVGMCARVGAKRTAVTMLWLLVIAIRCPFAASNASVTFTNTMSFSFSELPFRNFTTSTNIASIIVIIVFQPTSSIWAAKRLR